MSKDRSLQNIDVTKLLIYVLICIIACLAMIFGLLVPSIKEYKQVKYESRMQIAASAQTQRLYDAKSKALDEIKQNDKAQLDALENKFDADKFHGGEAGSFLRNLARDENEAQIYTKLQREAKEATKMFKKFDFMQMMTKLEMGNLKDGERAEIFAKMNKIAREI